MTNDDLLAAVAPVAECLDRLHVRFFVTGSAASSAHGVARASLDVDLVAELEPGHVESFTHDSRGRVRVLSGAHSRAPHLAGVECGIGGSAVPHSACSARPGGVEFRRANTASGRTIAGAGAVPFDTRGRLSEIPPGQSLITTVDLPPGTYLIASLAARGTAKVIEVR